MDQIRRKKGSPYPLGDEIHLIDRDHPLWAEKAKVGSI